MEIANKDEAGHDIVLVTIPHVPPEKNVEKYFESKARNGEIVKYPDWDVARADPAMNLIYARRDLATSQMRLEKKRQEFVERSQKLDAEWNDLTAKEENLRKNFIMFHTFVKENQEKKERGKRRINEEELIQERRDDEIQMILDRIAKMTNVRESLEESVGKLKMYEDYISNVVEGSPEFKSIMSVLNRYDALSAARIDLVSRQKEDLEELEIERINMMKLIEERFDVLMGLNNRLAELQAHYEKAKNHTRYWEAVVYRVKSKSTKELLKMFLVEHSIWNLYRQMCTKKNMPVEIDRKNVEEQLLYIKSTINEYKRITRIAAKKANKDVASYATSSNISHLS